VEAKLAALKEALAKEHYKSVLAGTSEIDAAMNTLKETIISRQTQIQAATNEWTDLSTEVPQLVEAIQSRVDSLSVSGKLPENVKKETFETAKAGLETMKSMWTEASNAFSAGNATEAADKARLVKAKAEELRQQLDMPVA
jgi:chromosome segregation ATPase